MKYDALPIIKTDIKRGKNQNSYISSCTGLSRRQYYKVKCVEFIQEKIKSDKTC